MKKECKNLEQYQGEELEKIWKVKAKVVPLVIGAFTNSKLKKSQKILGAISETSAQKTARNS